MPASSVGKSQTLFVEGWVTPEFSLALGPWWRSVWGTPSDGLIGYMPYPPQHSFGARAAITVAPWSFAGFGLDAWFGHRLSWNGAWRPDNFVGATLSFWLRTDGQIQRNWLER